MSQNISTTVNITNGIATFNYHPEGIINVTQESDVIFSLSAECSPAVSFKQPLTAYIPIDATKDVTPNLSSDGQSLTLSDSDIDQETICIQLVVEDAHGNQYASPDPRMVNYPR
ncbi:DP-EP family protein [Paraglaciecola aquimarina]|uniref:DP-EP family protein n=1 Tax=Paraglaciecola algarum TaxID=3050085 RepID=A0ABS9D8F3_9ALTE|nr:DP-EP family protein [Paraglaciecola sp. G1-23]MCF2948994.1 DP-EP family protein [Paraglaciecola sp. G1-23]